MITQIVNFFSNNQDVVLIVCVLSYYLLWLLEPLKFKELRVRAFTRKDIELKIQALIAFISFLSFNIYSILSGGDFWWLVLSYIILVTLGTNLALSILFFNKIQTRFGICLMFEIVLGDSEDIKPLTDKSDILAGQTAVG